jgi:hypothetical protein
VKALSSNPSAVRELILPSVAVLRADADEVAMAQVQETPTLNSGVPPSVTTLEGRSALDRRIWGTGEEVGDPHQAGVEASIMDDLHTEEGTPLPAYTLC